MAMGIFLLLVLIGSAAAWYTKSAAAEEGLATELTGLTTRPTYVVLDPFTMNLQPEVGEQFVLASFTVQIANQKQLELFNKHMPQVRSHVLMVIANKKSSDLTPAEGKNLLVSEIHTSLNQFFNTVGKPDMVRGVFLTSFVMQH